jgi:hypothetical protein
MIKKLEGGHMVFPKLARYFTDAEKELVIQEYLTTLASSGKRAVLLPPTPLRTVQARFPCTQLKPLCT